MRNEELEDLLEVARKVVEEAEADAEMNPSTDTIQIVVVEPNRKPYKKKIENSLEAMQGIVGGYIENVHIPEKRSRYARIGLVVNEEGKLLGLPFNRRIIHFDVLVGTFFITAYNREGDNVSLTDEECNLYINRFTTLEVYI